MLTTLALLAGLTLGQANDAAPDEILTAKVQALLKQLSSSEMAKRDAAEKDLVAIGPDVLGLLPTTNARTPAEEKVRIGRIRSALENAAAASVAKPSLISLSGEMPVSQALAKISAQSGNKLIDYRQRFSQDAADPKIKVDLDQAPFWEALDTVLDAAQLTLYNFDEEKGALAYTSREDSAAPRLGNASYSGLFRLEPKRIDASRNLKTGMHSLRLTFDGVWEPRVRPIVLEIPLTELKALDEDAKLIPINTSEGTLEVPVETSGTGVEIEIPFEAPARSVTRLALLKGRMTALVLGKVETFEFADIDKAKAVEVSRGGVVLVLENCRKNADIYDVGLRVRFERVAFESHRGWIYDNECYLIDPKGRRIENAGLEATLADVNEVGISYKFNLEGDTPGSYKLVYKTPAAVIPISEFFDIKDVDLP